MHARWSGCRDAIFAVLLATLLGWATDGVAQSVVEVRALYLEIPQNLAGQWGLDGGPAVAPETSPLGGDIPALMPAEQARKVITALRQSPGSRVVGSASAMMHSDETSIVRDVEEWYSPESYVPMSPQEGRSVPPTYPEFGEARDIGMVLEVTPQLTLRSNTIRLLLRPQLYRFTAYTRTPEGFPMPVIAALTTETCLSMPSGMTAIVSRSARMDSSTGAMRDLVTPRPKKKAETVTLLFISATVLSNDPEKEWDGGY